MKTTITHTLNLPHGSVVVIHDVPAYTFEENEVGDTVLDLDVALKIDEFVDRFFEESAGRKRRVWRYR